MESKNEGNQIDKNNEVNNPDKLNRICVAFNPINNLSAGATYTYMAKSDYDDGEEKKKFCSFDLI